MTVDQDPTGEPPPGSTRGRPRSAAVDVAVFQAVLELLGELGVARLSVDEIAGRAGVSKASIYRRWPSKAEMILDALHQAISPFDDVDTGAFASDLTAYLAELTERLRSGAVRDVIPYLIEAAEHDSRIATTLDRYVQNRRQPLSAIILRAVERGEISGKFADRVQRDVLIDLVTGPFMYRRLLTGEIIDTAFANSIANLVLRAATPDG